MNRLTNRKRRSGGKPYMYWSYRHKDEIVQRLGLYEDTGLEPHEICGWLDARYYQPVDGQDVIVTAKDKDGRLKVVQGKHDTDHGWITFLGLKVVAWMPMPGPAEMEDDDAED